eukprot:TRINITY_DN24275_c0_g1_i2.p1 TRINITY_DN24275_c0_g1~~TRINITY_DN24275_c0_g1_i2.p1  ORF type:complete len:248 (-),score=61.10 TRINITY_DN24275_c0_g1_i2:545-1288(-)
MLRSLVGSEMCIRDRSQSDECSILKQRDALAAALEVGHVLGRKLLVPQQCCALHPFKELFAAARVRHCSLSSLFQLNALNHEDCPDCSPMRVYSAKAATSNPIFQQKSWRYIDVNDDLLVGGDSTDDKRLVAQLDEMGATSAEVLEFSRMSGWFAGYRDREKQSVVQKEIDTTIRPSLTLWKHSWNGWKRAGFKVWGDDEDMSAVYEWCGWTATGWECKCASDDASCKRREAQLTQNYENDLTKWPL